MRIEYKGNSCKIEDNGCLIVTDCAIFIPFEAGKVIAGKHPEGLCVRRRDDKLEIAYVEMKNVKSIKQDQQKRKVEGILESILESIREKIQQELPITKNSTNLDIVIDETTKLCLSRLVSFLYGCQLQVQLTFYLVINSEALASFQKAIKSFGILPIAIKKVNALFLCECGKEILQCVEITAR